MGNRKSLRGSVGTGGGDRSNLPAWSCLPRRKIASVVLLPCLPAGRFAMTLRPRFHFSKHFGTDPLTVQIKLFPGNSGHSDEFGDLDRAPQKATPNASAASSGLGRSDKLNSSFNISCICNLSAFPSPVRPSLT